MILQKFGNAIILTVWEDFEGKLAKWTGWEYLYLGFQWKPFNFFENFSVFYDGVHSALWFMGFHICWGGGSWFKKIR